MAVLLVAIAIVLLTAHNPAATISTAPHFDLQHIAIGIVLGFGIGVVASLLGVAGGELLIPTLVLFFATDIKLAGSLLLAISLPTIIAGFTRYSRDQSFQVVSRSWAFLVAMAGGSIVGAFVGARLLGVVPNSVLLPALAMILVISAIKTWNNEPLRPVPLSEPVEP